MKELVEKKKHKHRLLPVLIMILLIAYVVTCCHWATPPGVNQIQTFFRENYEDIQLMTDWLLNSGYADVFFNEEDLREGKVWADFSVIPLDSEILSCAKRLWSQKGFHRISKHSPGNRVEFEIWSDLFEACCGIVYAEDPTSAYSVQYVLSVEPLSEENWYYFYSDYNKWRVLQTSVPDEQ